MLNKIIVMGRLTKDPELRQTCDLFRYKSELTKSGAELKSAN